MPIILCMLQILLHSLYKTLLEYTMLKRTKKHLLLPLIACLLTCTLFSSCNHFVVGSTADKDFRIFTNMLFQQEVASNTLNLHYTLQNPTSYGILDAPITYGTYSTDSLACLASLENCKSALHQFPYDTLSSENRLTYEVLDAFLNTSMKGANFLLYEEPLAPLIGMQSQLPVLLSEFQFHNSKDIEDYLALLSTTKEYFHSLIEFERLKSSSGLFMPTYIAQSIIKECNSFIDMDTNNFLFSSFSNRLDHLEDLSDEQYKLYVTQNEDLIKNCVFPAYQTLITALTDLQDTGKNQNGLSHLPDGKSYYEYVVAKETGSSRSISQLQKLTHTQLSKDLQSIQTTLSKLPDSTPSIPEVTCSSDPTVILSELNAKIAKTFPRSPDVTTRVKYVAKDMEAYLSPAFYMIPPIDNITENIIYVNQSNTPDGIELYTTLAHEGYPGHLYQTTYYLGLHPDPLRTLLNFNGYVEGWATYAEMCSYYLAPLAPNQALLLQRNASSILGIYALADMGIHYDGWNLLDTINFFKSYGIQDIDTIKSIFELIVSCPGNYLKYYIGYLEFLDLKKEALQQLGDDFSQTEFHKSILTIGPAPFDIIRKHLLVRKS